MEPYINLIEGTFIVRRGIKTDNYSRRVFNSAFQLSKVNDKGKIVGLGILIFNDEDLTDSSFTNLTLEEKSEFAKFILGKRLNKYVLLLEELDYNELWKEFNS